MKILSPDNTTVDINLIPDETNDYVRFSVLDLSKREDYDFYFQPLVYLETFNAPAVVLDIGGKTVQMPLLEPPNDWKILVGEPFIGELEPVSLEDLNSRDFSAFVFNPISSFMHSFQPVKIVDTYFDIKWHIPNMTTNYVLTVPLSDGPKPDCIYMVSGPTSRKFESVSIGDIL